MTDNPIDHYQSTADCEKDFSIDSYSIGNFTLNAKRMQEWSRDFRVPLAQARHFSCDSELDISVLINRYNLFDERVRELDSHIKHRSQKKQAFEQSMRDELKQISKDLSHVREKWTDLEKNPAATQRVTFLQEEQIRLTYQLHTTELDHVDQIEQKRAERFEKATHRMSIKEAIECGTSRA